jgi:hypothetical protein
MGWEGKCPLIYYSNALMWHLTWIWWLQFVLVKGRYFPVCQWHSGCISPNFVSSWCQNYLCSSLHGVSDYSYWNIF